MKSPFRFTTYSQRPVFVGENYEFKPTKVKWICRVLWWCLRKLNALSPRKIEYRTYEFTEQHERDIFDAVYMMIDDAIDQAQCREDLCIIMGRSAFQSLRRNDDLNSVLKVPKLRVRDPRFKGEVFGFPVFVENSMTGMMVMSKLDLKREVSPDYTWCDFYNPSIDFHDETWPNMWG